MPPLLAILGGIGLSFDSAYAENYVLDETFCTDMMNGHWNDSTCILDNSYTLSLLMY